MGLGGIVDSRAMASSKWELRLPGRFNGMCSRVLFFIDVLLLFVPIYGLRLAEIGVRFHFIVLIITAPISILGFGLGGILWLGNAFWHRCRVFSQLGKFHGWAPL